MIIVIIKTIGDANLDAEAPAEPDYNKTGWEFHQELKQRAKRNYKTIYGGNKKYGEFWLSGKDPYLIIEKNQNSIIIPYNLISEYQPYKYEHGVNKNILSSTLIGGVIAGPIGGIVGAIAGSGKKK